MFENQFPLSCNPNNKIFEILCSTRKYPYLPQDAQ